MKSHLKNRFKPYLRFPDGIRSFVFVFSFSIAIILFQSISIAQDNNTALLSGLSKENWQTLAQDITPFSIDVMIFVQFEDNVMERFSHIYMEYPDKEGVYQHASFMQPFPINYRSFALKENVIIHDLKSDSFAFMPSRLSPMSVFSLEESAASFFSKVNFEDIEPEIFESQETFVIKISMEPIELSPGMLLSRINGHMWIDSETARPIKLIVIGESKVVTEEPSATSIIVDFHYSDFSLTVKNWDSIRESFTMYENGSDDDGENIIRDIEEGLVNKVSF